ncbi:hypothetical protein KP509_22G041600 [Ceratopteris richardii]|nr:hypothetical protein KP509_22G041600 [Ceratopteris richardii]
MGKELEMLQKSLGDKNSLVFSSAALAEKNFHNLVDRSVNSGMVSEEVDIHAASVVTTQVQCNVLEKELEIKNEALVRQEAYVTKLDQQLLHLHLELQNREDSKQHLKHEVEKMEAEMKIAVYRMTNQKASELHSSLKEVKSKNTGHLMKNLVEKDEELARQREELRTLSAQLKMKARELQVQMDNHRKADQELKKRVIKLEFLLREARIQARKLQKVVEKKEKDLKDLQTQLASNASVLKRTAGFWGSSVFKFAASASALVLFIFMKH